MVRESGYSINNETAAKILFQYSVRGVSTLKLNIVRGFTKGDYLSILRDYGFDDPQTNRNSGGGKHLGLYSRGIYSLRSDPSYKITLTERVFLEFVESVDPPCEFDSFERYLDDMLEAQKEANERQKQLIEEQKKRERAEAERRREAEKRAAEQRAAEAERQRLAAEEARRKAEEIRRNTQRYNELYNQGTALERTDPNKALSILKQASAMLYSTDLYRDIAAEHISAIEQRQREAEAKRRAAAAKSEYELGQADYKRKQYLSAAAHFRNARESGSTKPDIPLYIALSLKSVSDACGQMSVENARTIADEMNRYLNYLAASGEDVYVHYYIILAEAYLTLGDKKAACNAFFMAGDIFYENESYREALNLYCKSLNDTGLWSDKSKAAPFRIAYAFTQCCDLDDQRVKSKVIQWYTTALENNIEGINSAENLVNIFSNDNDYSSVVSLNDRFGGYFTSEGILKVLFDSQIQCGQLVKAAYTADKLLLNFKKASLPLIPCARAYAERGRERNDLTDLSKACDMFFSNGDSFFTKGDFRSADKFYTMGYEETCLWSSKSIDAPFRMGYARMKCGKTDEDAEYAKKWLNVACRLSINSDKARECLMELG